MRSSILLLLVATLIAGCAKSEAPKSEAKPAPSSAQTLINGFTGRTAVNAGKKAREDLTRISEKRNADLEAAME